MYKIMIVEDDEKIANLMEEYLKRYGYNTISIRDFSKIKKEFVEAGPDVVLMDINLPYFDGFYWCREIRTLSRVPILFISARGSDMDQVMAIENGGDDYIIKPFSFEVLLAKVKSVIRRAYGEYSEGRSSDVYEVDGLYLFLDQNMVEFGGRRLELSKREFQLLYCLLKKANSIVPREELLEQLWDDVEFVDDNTLSVNITRLRKRLEEIGITDAIETKRGQGYCITKNWAVR